MTPPGHSTEGTQAEWESHRPKEGQGNEGQGTDNEDICWRSLSGHSRGENQRVLLYIWRGRLSNLHRFRTYLFSLNSGSNEITIQVHQSIFKCKCHVNSTLNYYLSILIYYI